MLCFDDASLARLIRAARAVPYKERQGWLRALAKDLDPGPPVSPALCRRRRSRTAHYRRSRDGKRVFKIETDYARTVEALSLFHDPPVPLMSLQEAERELTRIVEEWTKKVLS